MSLKIHKPVKILSHNGNEKLGEVVIEEFSKADRFKRTFKFLGLFWGLAIASAFIPLAHFILVPVFLIIGALSIGIVYPVQTIVQGGTGLCPYCEASFEIVRMKDAWPLIDQCTKCRREVSIVKV